MTTTLQQALVKAGLVSRERLQKAEVEKKRGGVRGGDGRRGGERSVGFLEGKHHHHLRTECEACRKNAPDVEYYEHRNKSLPHKWLCVKCADRFNIPDDCRQTMQSQNAQAGRFLREYGKTKVFR